MTHHTRCMVDGVPHMRYRQRRDQWIERMGARVEVVGECWVMDGKPDTYAKIAIGGRLTSAHRVSFEVFYPDVETLGMHIHHTCHQPGCVNPAHLQAMTPKDHMQEHAALRHAT